MTAERTAQAPAAGLHELLAARWSPRAFDAAADVSDDALRSLLEAARWSPSASNSQPWRFLVTERGTHGFAEILATLAPGNRVWAGGANLLLLVAAEVVDDEGRPRPWAHYDTGQAVAHLSTQAEHLGLSVHQMGGFDREAMAAAFDLPPTLEPVVVVAVGVRAAAHTLPEGLAERETAPRVRRSLDELVLDSRPAYLRRVA
jgi:nitroreductase